MKKSIVFIPLLSLIKKIRSFVRSLIFRKTLTMKLTMLIVSCLLFAAVHSAAANDPEVRALGYAYVIDQ